MPHTRLVAAVSADGKIADVSGDQSMLSSPADRRHLLAQMKDADLLIVGRRTFELHRAALIPYRCAVMTMKSAGIEESVENLFWWNPAGADFFELCRETDAERICLLGGSGPYTEGKNEGWADELLLTYVPAVRLPGGTPLFTDVESARVWELLDSGALGFEPAPMPDVNPIEAGLLLKRYVKA